MATYFYEIKKMELLRKFSKILYERKHTKCELVNGTLTVFDRVNVALHRNLVEK